MTTRILYLAIVTGFALQSCSSAPVAQMSAPSRKCGAINNAVDCDIEVTVTVSPGAPGGCTISIDPSLRTVEFVGIGKKKKISWTIITPGYTFPLNGVVFKNDNTLEFHKAKLSNNNRTYELTNKHSGTSTHEYRINVDGPDPIECTLDPIIINR